jgi:hypothetical protein
VSRCLCAQTLYRSGRRRFQSPQGIEGRASHKDLPFWVGRSVGEGEIPQAKGCLPSRSSARRRTNRRVGAAAACGSCLHREDYERWLSAKLDPRDLSRPFGSEAMRMWPTSTRRKTITPPSVMRLARRRKLSGRPDSETTDARDRVLPRVFAAMVHAGGGASI